MLSGVQLVMKQAFSYFSPPPRADLTTKENLMLKYTEVSKWVSTHLFFKPTSEGISKLNGITGAWKSYFQPTPIPQPSWIQSSLTWFKEQPLTNTLFTAKDSAENSHRETEEENSIIPLVLIVGAVTVATALLVSKLKNIALKKIAQAGNYGSSLLAENFLDDIEITPRNSLRDDYSEDQEYPPEHEIEGDIIQVTTPVSINLNNSFDDVDSAPPLNRPDINNSNSSLLASYLNEECVSNTSPISAISEPIKTNKNVLKKRFASEPYLTAENCYKKKFSHSNSSSNSSSNSVENMTYNGRSDQPRALVTTPASNPPSTSIYNGSSESLEREKALMR